MRKLSWRRRLRPQARQRDSKSGRRFWRRKSLRTQPMVISPNGSRALRTIRRGTLFSNRRGLSSIRICGRRIKWLPGETHTSFQLGRCRKRKPTNWGRWRSSQGCGKRRASISRQSLLSPNLRRPPKRLRMLHDGRSFRLPTRRRMSQMRERRRSRRESRKAATSPHGTGRKIRERRIFLPSWKNEAPLSR